MLAKTASMTIIGTDARVVEIEVHIGQGLPGLTIVGLPDRSVREAEQRMHSAFASSEEKWPQQKIVANLAPGNLRKEGAHFDLALAMGVLAADGKGDTHALQRWLLVGELALDGSVRPVRGVLAASFAAARGGYQGIICPAQNAGEAALVDDVRVIPVTSLTECKGFLEGSWNPPPVERPESFFRPPEDDIADVRGHAHAKRAVEIAAAGGHNLLMQGPPGSGKTMLARRLPGILPMLSNEEALAVTQIHSIAGALKEGAGLVDQRPFRLPHHHVSLAGLIGGGSGLARPGEVSLAHHGCLFLDELSLYPRHVLESLRAPLEDGEVTIVRAGGAVRYPSRFSLIAAMNPCPCGYLGDVKKNCTCGELQLLAYRNRLSGPLLDRFDIQIIVERVGKEEILGEQEGDPSVEVRGRVEAAREVQIERYGSALLTNASVPRMQLLRSLRITPEAKMILGAAIETTALSGRGVDRVMRVGRTIADLDHSDHVSDEHIASALMLRVMPFEEASRCA